MKIFWTASALADLDDIEKYLQANYPETSEAVARRIRSIIRRIGEWPSALLK